MSASLDESKTSTKKQPDVTAYGRPTCRPVRPPVLPADLVARLSRVMADSPTEADLHRDR